MKTVPSIICDTAEFRVYSILILFILYISTQTVQCTKRDDCVNVDGYNMYWDERTESCKKCLPCNPGYGLDKPCGDGEGMDAKCVECLAGFYSDTYGYKQCRSCQTCPHAKVLKECTTRTNRVCGQCDPGFYKHHIYGTCEPCITKNQDGCTEYTINGTDNLTIPTPRIVPVILNDEGKSQDNNNSTENNSDGLLYAAIVLPIVAIVLIIVLLTIILYMCRNKAEGRQRQDVEGSENSNNERETRLGVNGSSANTTEVNEGFTPGCTPDMNRLTAQSNVLNSQPEEVRQNEEGIPLLAVKVDNTSNQSSTADTSSSDSDTDNRVPEATGGSPTSPPTQDESVEDTELKERRTRAEELAKGKSISEDISYERKQEIYKRLKTPPKDFRFLASRVGMSNIDIDNLTEPEPVLQFMHTSMEGKRDIARLISELLKLPRYDIVDEVLCPLFITNDTEEQKD
ncbi:uncharacterized protein LOC144438625 isoform X2 [Glandiceps talaboti]